MLVLEMSGDAPRKVLKIDALRLHFDSLRLHFDALRLHFDELSEQHRQGRQVIRAGMKPLNISILQRSSNPWRIKMSFEGSQCTHNNYEDSQVNTVLSIAAAYSSF